MATFIGSNQQGDGSQAWDTIGPSPVPGLARPDHRDRRFGDRLWPFDIGRWRALRLRRLLADAETDEPRWWSN